jgi:hypothetical protein
LAWLTVEQTSTGDLAYQWVLANVPKVQSRGETSALLLPNDYQMVNTPSLLPVADYVADGVTYFLAASPDSRNTGGPRPKPGSVCRVRVLNDAVVVAAFDPAERHRPQCASAESRATSGNPFRYDRGRCCQWAPEVDYSSSSLLASAWFSSQMATRVS